MMLDQLLKITLLYDFYGALLTRRQQRCIERHYFDDLSLGEMAGELSVSRQAVHDIIKRSVDSLERVEAKLGLLTRHQKEQAALAEIAGLLAEAEQKNGGPALKAARKKTASLLAARGGG